jgi:hypothetical protein
MVVGGQRHVSAALPQRKRSVSIVQEARSVLMTDLTDAKKPKSLVPIGVQNPKRRNYYSDAIPASVEVMLIKSRTMKSAQNVAHMIFR